MHISTVLFLASVAVAGGVALAALVREDRPGFALFKPLTTFIVLLGAAYLIRPAAQPYRSWIVLGLALSLAGDVLLLPTVDRFRAGLAAFLLAHVAYLGAFTLSSPVARAQLPLLAPFVLFGGAAVLAAWPGLGARRVPVLAYLVVVCAMAWRAAARGGAPGVSPASFRLALAGASLFLVSDAILVVRRFRLPSRTAHTVELGLYWVAQTLLALSVRS